ncbi:hypothetical protein Tco_1242056, partial [Tanacetum coccineum]
SIPCSSECKIVGQILLDHPLSYALIATADVPVVYLQQFWRTVSKRTVRKVPNTKDTIKFLLDTQQFTYTVDMFRDTLHLPVETPDTPFVAPANIHTIEAFMNKVGYQGVVDKKMEAIQYPCFIKLIIADLMKKFPNIPKRLEEDYHSIKDDVPLTKKRKQIAGESSSSRKSLKVTIKQKEILDAEKNDVDSEDRLEPGSHKENPEVVDDDDDNARENKDDTMGSLEIRSVLRRMCRRQGYMIQDIERKCVITKKFWETHNKFDQVLKEVIPEIAENAINDLIEYNLKPCIAETIIEDQSLQGEEENVVDEDEVIPEDVAPELIAESQNVDKRVPTIFDHARMEATLRDSLSNLSRNAEEYAYDLDQSTSFIENQIYGNTKEKKYILSLHKIHAEEFLELDLEEKLNRWVRKEFKTFNEDAQLSIQHCNDSWHKRVYTQNQKKVKKNPEDYYSNHKITEVVRIVTDQPHGLDFMKQILVMRANDKPDSFSEVDFKYLNKNDIEDLYYLCRIKEIDNRKIKLMNSLITFIRSCVIWERVYDFQLGIESYQMKVNLKAPTLTFPGIEEHAPYTIVDEPQMGLIYLNSKDEKRLMYLEEIVKFCDATLEKVLNEVKLRMFESKFLKKPPLLGELDQDIMKAYEREISKRLSHRQQMRRWESFVNGRPILPTMKRL